ncbi:hypothetical protein GCM10009818_03900 [Nakamurella flavida]
MVVLVGLTVAGCSQQMGSAAVVGGTAISDTTVQDGTAAVIAASGTDPGDATRATVARTVATQAIRTRLLDSVARERGAQVSTGQVAAVVAQAGTDALATQLQVSAADVPAAVRDILTLSALFEQLPPEGVAVTDVLVTVQGVQVATRDEAVAKRSAFLADPSALTAEIARGAQGAVDDEQLSLLAQPSAAPIGLYRAAVGSIVLYPSQTGYLVLRIVDRTEQPGTLTAAAVADQPPTVIRDLGALLLTGYAQQAGVSVNPRYGVWDSLALQVVPADDGL